jgi:hypothetical protein
MAKFGRINGWEGWKKARGGDVRPWYADHISEEFEIDPTRKYPGRVCFTNTGYAYPEDITIITRDA